MTETKIVTIFAPTKEPFYRKQKLLDLKGERNAKAMAEDFESVY